MGGPFCLFQGSSPLPGLAYGRKTFSANTVWSEISAFLLALIAYLVLHELAHGAAYRTLTHQKLRFGISPSAAFCGVPDIYVYRRTALISLLTPFVLFIPVFLIPAFLLPNAWDKIYVLFLFAMHIGGCSGDLYDTALYLFKFKDPATLMQDTGPKQTFIHQADESPLMRESENAASGGLSCF